MITSRSLILGLLTALVFLSPASSRAYRITSAETLPLDATFVERLATDRFQRGDLLGLLALTGEGRPSTSASLELRGDALFQVGLYGESIRSYSQAIAKGPEDPSSARSAVEKYLLTARILTQVDELALPEDLESSLTGRPALFLGAQLLNEGQTSRGIELLRRSASGPDLQERVLATATLAQHRARQGDLSGAISSLGTLRTADTSAYTDLYYLARGNLNLFSGSFSRARESFLAIPPGSPFYPEALHGLAWTLIRSGDLTGASIRLSELINRHPFSDATPEAVLDLALCYRDLGLYDLASRVLSEQMRRFSDFGNWMRSLKARDLAEGGDLLNIVLPVLEKRPPESAVLSRLPDFALAWSRRAAGDAELARITSLLHGIRRVDEARTLLHGRMENSQWEVEREIYWTTLDLKAVEALRANLDNYLERLPQTLGRMDQALDSTSLDRFSTDSSQGILARIAALETRLNAMESSVSKSQGFSAVIEGLASSVTSQEDEQLIRIRRHAYESLMSSRTTLNELRSDLRRLTGKVWLVLKMEAVRYKGEKAGQVTSSVESTNILLARALRVQELLESRLVKLREASQDLRSQTERIGRSVKASLSALRDMTIEARTSRLLEINAQLLEELEMAEARTMYTAADIETTQMQELLRAMQEAVP